MTDIQTSLPLFIVWPSVLNPVINFSTHLWLVKWNALQIYFCLTHFIPSPSMLMQHMHQPYHKWYDPLHIITWPYWFIDLDFTCSSLLPRSISTKSSTCPSLIQPVCQASLVLIFSTLVTWLHDSMVCLICNELLHHMFEIYNFSSHLHLNGIGCSHMMYL
jgi:hypothetical protein